MRTSSLRLEHVSFWYDTSAAPVLGGVTFAVERGWMGVVGPNGGGKSTLLRLIVGEVQPSEGRVLGRGRSSYCPQRTDDPPTGAAEFAGADDHEACRLRGVLAIEPQWLERWNTLSHGERKRFQIGIALWQRPDVLAIDEPTNHLDSEARELLVDALRAFDGIGVLVSHDRDLLDTLCSRCAFVDRGEVILRPGGYTAARQALDIEEQAARNRFQHARREAQKLQRALSKRREEASHADRKRSKRHLDRHDSGGRAAIDRARVSGKDGQAGRLVRQLDGRVEQARTNVIELQTSARRKTGVQIAGRRAQCDRLVLLPAATIALGNGRVLEHPDLRIEPGDRIALVGPNGAGKTTLLARLVPLVRASSADLLFVPQELDAAERGAILRRLHQLPSALCGELLSHVSRLGCDPLRVLQTDNPSPGELRKLALALGLLSQPSLIVLDEPTNHLDLPSMECLEAALRDCESALLLVSHDTRFLASLTATRWEVRIAGDAGNSVLRVVG